MNRIAWFVLVFATFVCAGQKGNTKVDSMVYETGAEWRNIGTDGPALAFAVQKDVLWFLNAKNLGWVNMNSGKKGDKQIFSTIGSIPATDATCLAVDNSGTLWVGTKGGCAMRTKETFTVFTTEKGLADNGVNAIFCDKAGKVWVGTDNGVSVYQNGVWKSYTSKDGLIGDKVQCIVVSTTGTAWFGTTKGISSLEGGTWTNYSMKNGLSWNDTKALAIDPRTQTIWAAVGDKDMNSFNGKEWKVYMEVGTGIKSIMADTQSRIWISSDDGLMKFNGDEWVSDPAKLGITVPKATQLYKDDKGNLFFGSEGGVIKLNNPYPY
jgi:ligand-binding sensor domain-containing protein